MIALNFQDCKICIDWLIDWLIDYLNNWKKTDYLTDWLTGWLKIWNNDLLIDQFVQEGEGKLDSRLSHRTFLSRCPGNQGFKQDVLAMKMFWKLQFPRMSAQYLQISKIIFCTCT